jgi:hypothetical protein
MNMTGMGVREQYAGEDCLLLGEGAFDLLHLPCRIHDDGPSGDRFRNRIIIVLDKSMVHFEHNNPEAVSLPRSDPSMVGAFTHFCLASFEPTIPNLCGGAKSKTAPASSIGSAVGLEKLRIDARVDGRERGERGER